MSAIEVDLTPISVGQGITVLWQGKPIFVRHRTDKEIKEAEDVPAVPADRAATGSGAGEAGP